MEPCAMKGCKNPAMGIFKMVTRRSTHRAKLCGPCGFSAHRRRRFVVMKDDRDREYTMFPLQYKSIELVQILGTSYNGAQPARPSWPTIPLRKS